MDDFLVRLPEIVIQLCAFALAISVHESAHGLAAERLGDPTARWLGRITLNPIAHVDPFGTVLFPLMLAAIGAPVLGWAKPVPFVSRNLRDQRWGPALVALAGPGSNLVAAAGVTLALFGLKFVVPEFRPLLVASVNQGATAGGGVLLPLLALLYWLAAINVVLTVFNLVPVPPLDGSHILGAALPPRAAWRYEQFRPFGIFVLFALMWTGLFGHLLRPFLGALSWILLS
ncbi:MAG: site-2 protease family protein [Acidobacteriota bacterium]